MTVRKEILKQVDPEVGEEVMAFTSNAFSPKIARNSFSSDI
jgi:hypothetical protein